MSDLPSRPVVVLALAAVLSLAACASATGTAAPSAVDPSPASSNAPSATPTSTPADPLPADAIVHPTGHTDVVLRASTQGGFVRMEVVMGRAPEFTLYGDGRVLLLPEDVDADPAVPRPLREVRLTEDEVQRILAFALTEGRLGLARDAYPGGNIDAPSTVIEIHAGGVDKTVLVTGLVPDPAPGPDAADLAAFASLLTRLRALPTTADYEPERVVAILAETEPGPGVATVPWPWPALAPADFAQPADDDPLPFPRRLLEPAERDAVGATAGDGPLSLQGPDGRTYVLVIRPALPERSPRPADRGRLTAGDQREDSSSQPMSGSGDTSTPSCDDVQSAACPTGVVRPAPGCASARRAATAAVDR